MILFVKILKKLNKIIKKNISIKLKSNRTYLKLSYKLNFRLVLVDLYNVFFKFVTKIQ